MAKILDGKWLAKALRANTKRVVVDLQPRLKRAPGLGVILVGDNPASHTYVAAKEKAAHDCGLVTFDQRLPATATADEVQAAIRKFNQLPEVDGILLQLPLPPGLPSQELVREIDPAKDCDGLHPFNQGLLMQGEGFLRPCTPCGVLAAIDLALSPLVPGEAEERAVWALPKASLAGRKAVVVGRSILVGKPVGLMLLERHATVTLAHSQSPNLAAIISDAEIVVAAIGRPQLLKGDWIKEGAIVIDVGINRLPDGRLVGDVEYERAALRASAITPVPGGIGPLTIAMLLQNTVEACSRRIETRA